MHAVLTRRQRDIETLQGKLTALSPLRVLERGYSLTHDEAGHLIRRQADVSPGDAITVTVHEGRFAARVVAPDDDPKNPKR